jgi:hypothetical protein
LHAGISKGLKELQADLDNDLESGVFTYSTMQKDEKQRLINQLLEHRYQARTSMRATMKTAQIDASNTAERIGNEVHFFCPSGAHGRRSDEPQLMDLFEHTGVRAFACFSRGHADDPSRAHSVDSDDAMDFMLQGMEVTSQHFMRKFEQWSCNIDNGEVSPGMICHADADVLNLLSGSRQAVKNGASAARADVSRLMNERLCKLPLASSRRGMG